MGDRGLHLVDQGRFRTAFPHGKSETMLLISLASAYAAVEVERKHLKIHLKRVEETLFTLSKINTMMRTAV